MNATTITRRQQEVLAALCRLAGQHGRIITLAEIAHSVGSSPSSVFEHLRALEAAGRVRHPRGHKGYAPIAAGGLEQARGWSGACAYLRERIEGVLLAHHAELRLTQAVLEAIREAERAPEVQP